MKKSTTSVVIEQQSESKKRGVLAVILAVAFVAMLGIGTTYAYMKWTGNQTPNRFTADTGLEVDLVEPAWTDAVNNLSVKKWPNVASDGSTLIPTAANNFSKAGSVVAKDPYVINVSTVGNEGSKGQDAYVGIRLTFQRWVATSVGEGVGEDHKENGYYTTMTDAQAQALLSAYAFSQETTPGTAATVANTVPTAADGSAMTAASAGFYPCSDWTQVDGTSGNATTGYKAQMYFIYNKGITAEEGAVDGKYTAAVAKGAGTQTSTTTSTLFNSVTVIDEDQIDSFVGMIKGSSTDPGWRVLVDTAAINCKDISKGAFDTGGPGSTGRQQILTSFAEVRADGRSPQSSAYVTKNYKKNADGTYATDADGNKILESITQHGSGSGANASNVPEAYWGWEKSTTETNWDNSTE